MAERICDVDDKKKNIEGGKACENGHFICKEHIYSGLKGAAAEESWFSRGSKEITASGPP